MSSSSSSSSSWCRRRDFEELRPGTCRSLQLPSPSPSPSPWPSSSCSCSCSPLSVSVLDAPASFFAPSSPFAAIVAPRGREADWIFSAPAGLWDLLFSASVSRLVVLRIRPNPNTKPDGQGHSHGQENGEGHIHVHVHEDGGGRSHGHVQEDGEGRSHGRCGHGYYGYGYGYGSEADFKKHILPLLHSLFPWRSFPDHGPPADPFVVYEDGVRDRSVVEMAHSPAVGGILVEDVELDGDGGGGGGGGGGRNGDGDGDGDGDGGRIGDGIGGRTGGRIGDGDEISQSCDLIESSTNRKTNLRLLRRRMRFRSMPNLIQTEVPLLCYRRGELQRRGSCSLEDVRDARNAELELKPDHSEIVHSYLPPIVAGLILASPSLDACRSAGDRVGVLSIGLGGGALPMFLRRRFEFEVLAIDADAVVVDLARRHFGFGEDELLRVEIRDGFDVVAGIAAKHVAGIGTGQHVIGDGSASASAALMEDSVLKEWSQLMMEVGPLPNDSSREEADPRVHVIVLDVDAEDACLALLSPPPSFLSRAFLLGARIALRPGGIFIVNVIPRDERHLKLVMDALQEHFDGIYRIRCDANHVLFALASKVGDLDLECSFACELMQVVGVDLLNQIEEIN